MIFGLEEAADEDIHSTVKLKEVFMTIKGKPFFKAEKIGKQHFQACQGRVGKLNRIGRSSEKVQGAQKTRFSKMFI